jgi:hypothetical protein
MLEIFGFSALLLLASCVWISRRNPPPSSRTHFKAVGAGAEQTASELSDWLRNEVAGPLGTIAIGETVEEDYGAGFWVRSGPEPYWVAVSPVADDVKQPTAEFVVTVAHDPGLNPLRRLRSIRDRSAFDRLDIAIASALAQRTEYRARPI